MNYRTIGVAETDLITPGVLRTLGVLLELQRSGPVRVRDIAAVQGVNFTYVARGLRRLRAAGLVSWEGAGTYRANVEVERCE